MTDALGAIEAATGTADANRCEGNKQGGIGIFDSGTAPTLTNNQCVGNERFGICFAKGSRGLAEGNRCEKNVHDGIIVANMKTSPRLRGNQMVGNKGFGLNIDRRAEAELLDGNTYSENGKGTVSWKSAWK